MATNEATVFIDLNNEKMKKEKGDRHLFEKITKWKIFKSYLKFLL